MLSAIKQELTNLKKINEDLVLKVRRGSCTFSQEVSKFPHVASTDQKLPKKSISTGRKRFSLEVP